MRRFGGLEVQAHKGVTAVGIMTALLNKITAQEMQRVVAAAPGQEQCIWS